MRLMYGYDDRNVNSKHCKNNENTFLYPTKQRLVRHTNLIKLRDERMFVCYEPEHIVNNGKDELKHGSFLLEIKAKDKQKAEQSFLNEIRLMEKAV